MAWTCIHQERFPDSQIIVHYMAREMTEAEHADVTQHNKATGSSPVHVLQNASTDFGSYRSLQYADGMSYIVPMALAHFIRGYTVLPG